MKRDLILDCRGGFVELLLGKSEPAVKRRADRAGTHRIHANAVRRELCTQRPHKRTNRCFRGRQNRKSRHAHFVQKRSRHNDATTFRQQWSSLLNGEEDTLKFTSNFAVQESAIGSRVDSRQRSNSVAFRAKRMSAAEKSQRHSACMRRSNLHRNG